jgi:hypothetical protein
MACSQVSRPSGVRTISTCGAPAAVLPSSSSGSSSFSSRPAGGAVLSSTLTGVSSAASVFSPASAAGIAASRPALPSSADKPPFGHLRDDLRVNDLRPPGPGSLRAAQPGPALTALRRRRRVLLLPRIGVPGQALPGMAGLTAPPAVFAPFPLRSLPRPPLFLSPDPLLRRRRPRVRTVHPQPALQLRQPQLQRPLALPRRVKARPQQPDLGVLRAQHLPQPRVRSAARRRHQARAHRARAAGSHSHRQRSNRRTPNRTPRARATTQCRNKLRLPGR